MKILTIFANRAWGSRLVDANVMPPDSEKCAGKTVQRFRAFAVLTFEQIPQQCLERLDGDDGYRSEPFDPVSGEDQRRRRLKS